MSCPSCLDMARVNFANVEYAQFKASAENGCKSCEVIVDACNAAYTEHGLTGNWKIEVRPDRGTVSLSVRVGTKTGFLPFELHVRPGETSPWPWLASQDLRNDDPRPKECADYIRKTMERCTTDHVDCRSGKGTSDAHIPHDYMPTRLVYVGKESPRTLPLLCELRTGPQQTLTPKASYVALSHCWGGETPIATTRANYSTFRTTGIPWECLPKTFRELIDVTRELDIDYVWIDALCIIQDSPEDWSREASEMGQIFTNAIITIGASGSLNGHQGLFNRHKVHQFPRNDKGKAYTLCVRTSISHELSQKVKDTPSSPSNLPLRRRAWCFQEELLSPRFIHFTRDEMDWVCRGGTTCECDHRWIPRSKIPDMQLEDDHSALAKERDIWLDFLATYLKRGITYHRDRLPALSSLSRHFTHSGAYLAGLWQLHMPQSLLWRSNAGKRQKLPDRSGSLPPSWTWASVEDADLNISMMSSDCAVAHLVDSGVYTVTEDPRGLISGGHVSLEGPLLPVMYEPHVSAPKELAVFSKYSVIQHSTAPWTPTLASLIPDFEADTVDRTCRLDGKFDTSDQDESAYLAILAYESYNGEYYGLLLRPLERSNSDQKDVLTRTQCKLGLARIGWARFRYQSRKAEFPGHLKETYTIF